MNLYSLISETLFRAVVVTMLFIILFFVLKEIIKALNTLYDKTDHTQSMVSTLCFIRQHPDGIVRISTYLPKDSREFKPCYVVQLPNEKFTNTEDFFLTADMSLPPTSIVIYYDIPNGIVRVYNDGSYTPYKIDYMANKLVEIPKDPEEVGYIENVPVTSPAPKKKPGPKKSTTKK